MYFSPGDPPADKAKVAQMEQNDYRDTRQDGINGASIVCRDGTAYLMGYGNGQFATPYYKNGRIVLCAANGKLVQEPGS